MNGKCNNCDCSETKIANIDHNGIFERIQFCPKCYHSEVIEE